MSPGRSATHLYLCMNILNSNLCDYSLVGSVGICFKRKYRLLVLKKLQIFLGKYNTLLFKNIKHLLSKCKWACSSVIQKDFLRKLNDFLQNGCKDILSL